NDGLNVYTVKAPSAKTINAPVPKFPSKVVRCAVIKKPIPPPRNINSSWKKKPSTVGIHNIAITVHQNVLRGGSNQLPSKMRTPPRKLQSTRPNAATPNHL